MKKLYCVICGKYRKFEKAKISYILEKILVLSIISGKCKNEDQKIFSYFKNMGQDFRLKNVDETRIYFLEDI